MRTPFVLSLLALLGLPPTLFAAGAAESVAVIDPYVRAVPSGAANSAGFLRLRNDSGTDQALVAAESPSCEVVELHTQGLEGGVTRMRRVERIELPAGATVSLAPGGLHLMLIGLKGPLSEGEELPLTLVFADGSRLLLAAPVRRPEAEAGPDQPHHHH